jgi:asparagine synthase (glutamine-hydrolysing)
MKALHDDCPKFELFPPGHLYSSAGGGFRRWYNPEWFAELVPATPYQPLVLREAFEKVHTCRTDLLKHHVIIALWMVV